MILLENCLKSGQFGQNNCCHRFWKVAQSAINRPNWSHCQRVFETFPINLHCAFSSSMHDWFCTQNQFDSSSWLQRWWWWYSSIFASDVKKIISTIFVRRQRHGLVPTLIWIYKLVVQWLWLSWYSGCFRHQRSTIRIHCQNLYWTLTVNCIEKTKIKKKETEFGSFFKKIAKLSLTNSLLNILKNL